MSFKLIPNQILFKSIKNRFYPFGISQIGKSVFDRIENESCFRDGAHFITFFFKV